MANEGAFIILEGADGAGTTTQSQLLFQYLLSKYPSTKPVLTAEPSAGPIGQLLRELLCKKKKVNVDNRGMAALFFADRIDHYKTVVCPAVAQGQWVVSDRGYQSTLVYQALAVENNDCMLGYPYWEPQWIKQLHQNLPQICTYCFVLDVPFDVVRSRRLQRGEPAQLYDDDQRQMKICAAYQQVPRWDSCSRIIECYADTVADVHQQLQKQVDEIAELSKVLS